MWKPLNDSQCRLGESPFWHPDEQSLYWIDIAGRAVLRTCGDIGAAPAIERWSLPSEPGCMAPARSGGLVIALRDGIYRAREWGGELALLAPADYDIRSMRFNDGKCDPLGRFWAGTINEAKSPANAALYCLDARGGRTPTLARMTNGATTANGLAFALDRRTLYWADTPAHKVRAWDWDAEANVMSNERVFLQFAPKPAGWTPDSPQPYGGRPDGATIDAEGCYWVSMYEGAQLLRFSAAGDLLESLPVPARCPTMPCLGGADLRSLFLTSAREGRPAAELAEQPDAGRVFARAADVAGVPVAFFED